MVDFAELRWSEYCLDCNKLVRRHYYRTSIRQLILTVLTVPNLEPEETLNWHCSKIRSESKQHTDKEQSTVTYRNIRTSPKQHPSDRNWYELIQNMSLICIGFQILGIYSDRPSQNTFFITFLKIGLYLLTGTARWRRDIPRHSPIRAQIMYSVSLLLHNYCLVCCGKSYGDWRILWQFILSG